MALYVKKPVVVEAFRWVGRVSSGTDPQWVIDAINDGRIMIAFDKEPELALKIKTLEGEMRARFGDYIIKGVRGELYPCRGDIFHDTYELVKGGNDD